MENRSNIENKTIIKVCLIKLLIVIKIIVYKCDDAFSY